MAEVRYDMEIRRRIGDLERQVAHGGGGGHNGEMEARVTKLEATVEKTDARLHAIEKDLAVIRAEMKATVAEAKNSIIMWVVSAILLAQVLPGVLKKFGF